MTIIEFWERSKQYSDHPSVSVEIDFTGIPKYRSWDNTNRKWVDASDPEKVLEIMSGKTLKEIYPDIQISSEETIITLNDGSKIAVIEPVKQPWEIQQEVFNQLNEYFPDTPIGEQMGGEGDDVEPL